MKNKLQKQLVIYQNKSGAIEFRGDFKRETIWGTQKQIAKIFGVNSQAITRHIKNIYKEGELGENQTCSKMEQVQTEGGKTVKRKLRFYNLDMIISIGYRINSRNATQFRIWATKTLKQHLINGYTINKKRIGQNYKKFMQAVTDTKALLPAGNKVKTEDILELIQAFASTWVSLEAFDKDEFPKKGNSQKKIRITAEELSRVLIEFKKELVTKKQATDIFGQERSKKVVEGIVGNVFQSVFGKDVYESAEEKAVHLLYFMVKNHPFVDGNKRNGAFAFVWFLRKSGLLRTSLTPEALTALTLFIAESRPKDRNKMIGLSLLLLKKK